MKKFGVDRYVADYRVVEYTNEKGKVRRKTEYIGAWYVPLISEQKQRRLHVFMWIGAFAVFASILGGLLQHYAAESELYVVLPCAIALLPAFYMILALFAQPKVGQKMERMQHEHGYIRIGRSALAVLILVGVGLIGVIVYDILCLNHTVDKTLGLGDALFFGLMLLTVALSVFLIAAVRNMEITIEELQSEAAEK